MLRKVLIALAVQVTIVMALAFGTSVALRQLNEGGAALDPRIQVPPPSAPGQCFVDRGVRLAIRDCGRPHDGEIVAVLGPGQGDACEALTPPAPGTLSGEEGIGAQAAPVTLCAWRPVNGAATSDGAPSLGPGTPAAGETSRG